MRQLLVVPAVLVCLGLGCKRDLSLPEPQAVPAIQIDSVIPLVATSGDVLVVEARDLNQNALSACSVHVGSARADCTVDGSTCHCELLIDASVPEGNPAVSVAATSTAGLTASSALAPFYVDRLPPVIDEARIEVLRNAPGTADAITGEGGAITESGTYPSAGVVEVTLWDGPAGAAIATTGAILPAGSGSFTTVSLAGTEDASPPQLWVSARDFMGNETGRVALTRGIPSGGPVPDANTIELLRTPVGGVDSVSFPAASFAGVCQVRDLEAFSDAAGTSSLGTATATSAALPSIAVGDSTRSYSQVWIRAVDKCGMGSGAPFEVLRGHDLEGPSVNLDLAAVLRVPVGATDSVRLPAGTFAGTCFPASASVFDAEAGGSTLAIRPISTDRSAADVPVGSTVAAPPHLYLEVENKCGVTTGARVRVAQGDGTGVNTNPSLITLNRYALGTPDTVTGTGGAFSSNCALTILELQRPDTQAVVGTGTLDPVDGSFGPTAFGSATQSFPTVWLRALDKCGQELVTTPGTGTDNQPPVLEPFSAVATVGHAGELVEVSSTGPLFDDPPFGLNDAVSVYAEDDAPTAQSAPVTASADGSVATLSFTPAQAPQWVRLVATDKSGNSTSALVPQLNGRWTFAGRTRWNHGAAGPELVAFPFVTDEQLAGPAVGPLLGPEADNAQYAALAAADGTYLTQSVLASETTSAAGWQEVPAGAIPNALHNFAMARDLTAPEVTLTGGRGPACCGGQGPVLDQVVEGPGTGGTTSWSVDGTFGAPARELHAMAFDSWRSRLVVFGGADGALAAAHFNDTLEFAEGGDTPGWSVRGDVAANAPSPRARTPLAFDAGRGRMVLFGGFLSTGTTDNETWEYDGRQWIRMTPAGPTPLARCGHSLAYDGARNVVVMTGGSTGGNETWEYGWDRSIRNTRWTLRETGSHPPLEDAAMVYDARRRKVMLTGGKSAVGDPLSVSLDWDGPNGVWVDSAGADPTARFEHAMAYSPDLSRVVLYGGAARDTWIHQATTPHKRMPGLAAVLRMDPSAKGNALTVTWTGWASGDQGGGDVIHGANVYLFNWNIGFWTTWGQNFVASSSTLAEQTVTVTLPEQEVPSYLQGGALWIMVLPQLPSSFPSGLGIPSTLNSTYLGVELGYSPY